MEENKRLSIGILSALRMRGLHDKRHLLGQIAYLR